MTCDLRAPVLYCMSKEGDMSKKAKTRNWLAVRAHLRSGAGKHKDKSKYTRKTKHKGAQ